MGASDIPFTPKASDYACAETWTIMRIMLPIIIAVILASAVLSTYDIRFVIAGLMVIFTICPMAMLLLWIKLTGRTDMRLRMRPQKWEVSPEGLKIFFFNFDTDNPAPHSSLFIPASDIESFERKGSRFRLRTKQPDAGLLVVPDGHLDSESIKRLSATVFYNIKAKDDDELA